MHYLVHWSGYDPPPDKQQNYYPVTDLHHVSHHGHMLERMLRLPKFAKLSPAERQDIRGDDEPGWGSPAESGSESGSGTGSESGLSSCTSCSDGDGVDSASE